METIKLNYFIKFLQPSEFIRITDEENLDNILWEGYVDNFPEEKYKYFIINSMMVCSRKFRENYTITHIYASDKISENYLLSLVNYYNVEITKIDISNCCISQCKNVASYKSEVSWVDGIGDIRISICESHYTKLKKGIK